MLTEEINMRETLVKFSKRKNFFGTLNAEWATLFEGRAEEEEDDIDALFGEAEDDDEEKTSPKKRRALELSSSFSAAAASSVGGRDNGTKMTTFTKQAENDIALSAYHDTPSAPKRSKTHPSKVESINEWYREVVKHGQNGSIGLVPSSWESKFPMPSPFKVQLLNGTTLNVLEHYAQWKNKKT